MGFNKAKNDFINDVYKCNDCMDHNDMILYQLHKKAKIGMMMQNPGGDPRKKIRNKEEENFINKINIETEDLKTWLLNRTNNSFFSSFFKMLKPELIRFQNFDDYVTSGNIFADVYFFDAVKCRCKTKKLKDKHFNTCMKNYFNREMKLLENLEVLFIFSTRTWEAFKRMYSPKFLDNDVSLRGLKVTHCHGYLFSAKINKKEIYVIPLVHMSPVSYNKTLRNSYFDYLKEGLNLFNQLKANKKK